MTATPSPTDDVPLGQLVTRLSEQTSDLIRAEMRLARAELTVSARNAGVGAGLLSGAGLIAAFGVLCLLTAAIAGLALVLPVWAAALIVAAVLLAGAGIAALLGKRELAQASPVPDRAVDEAKQTIDDVKEAARGRH